MKIEAHTETIEVRSGHRLHRYLYRPPFPPLGGVVMIHGLGEHLGRYEHLAEFFCRRGLACIGVDLPGHGRSSGQRGHIPGFKFLKQLLDDEARILTDGMEPFRPLGVFAHSMGGYVALEYLPQRPDQYQFAWLSSPLVSPSANQHPLKVELARYFGRLVPRLPFKSGVTAVNCRKPNAVTGKVRLPDPLLHSSVSAGFGTELIVREKAIARNAAQLNPNLRLLVTHGTEDRVCCPELSRGLFETLPVKDKRFVDVHGSLHEPIHDEADWVLEKAGNWFTEIGFPVVDEFGVASEEAKAS